MIFKSFLEKFIPVLLFFLFLTGPTGVFAQSDQERIKMLEEKLNQVTHCKKIDKDKPIEF